MPSTTATPVVPTFQDLERAIANACASFTGLDWSDALDVGDALRKGRIVEPSEVSSWVPSDGVESHQRHHRALRALRRRIEHEIDTGCDDALREEIAQEADALQEEEGAYVRSCAEAAQEAGAEALEHARAGDLVSALECAERASQAEREFGDDPAWGTPRRMLVAMVEAAE